MTLRQLSLPALLWLQERRKIGAQRQRRESLRMSSHTSEEDTKNDVLRRTAGLEPVSSPEALSLDDRASTRRRKRKSRFVSLWPQDREEAQESLPRRQEQLFPDVGLCDQLGSKACLQAAAALCFKVLRRESVRIQLPSGPALGPCLLTHRRPGEVQMHREESERRLGGHR